MTEFGQCFVTVCVKRRKLKVNANKSKVMVCEQSRSEVVDFVRSYRVETECEKERKIILNGEEMEEVNEFKYLGSVMSKHSGRGDTTDPARGKVAGPLGCIVNGRSVRMEVQRDLRNTIIVPTLTYASETRAWNGCWRCRVQAVEMSYMRSACDVSRMDRKSSESVYECFVMSCG